MEDEVETLFHFLEALRVKFDLFEIVAQVAGEVGEIFEQEVGALGEVRFGGVGLRQRGHGLCGLSQQVGGGGRVGRGFVEDGQRLLRVLGERFGVGEPVALFSQFLVFAFLQPGGFDLLGLEGEHFGAARRVRLRGAQAGEFAAQVNQRVVGFAVIRQQGGHVRETVEQSQVGARVEQGQVFALAVDVHERRAHLPKQGQAHGPAIESGNGTSLAADFARQRHVVGVIFQVLAFQDFIHRHLRGAVEGERPLDEGRLRLGADDGRVGAAADEHDHRVEDDGFARAGLAGQDGESRAEFQVEAVNDGEVLDAEFGEHII